MNIDAARAALIAARAITGPEAARVRAVRDLLVTHGVAALGVTSTPAPAFEALIARAAEMPQSDSRRSFAVLVIHALAHGDLVPRRSAAERDLHRFLETALLNPLRRASYPFEGSMYDKRSALSRLHTTIEEHLRPPEASIPAWIYDLGLSGDP